MGVNPKCIDDCTALEQANLTKLHTFAAKDKVNTYSENFFQSDDSVQGFHLRPAKGEISQTF